MVKVIFSPEFLEHKTGLYHPECPERLSAIVNQLKSSPWEKQLQWLEPTSINQRDVLQWVSKIHTPEHINSIKQIASRGGGKLDVDTAVSARSYDVALLAVSAWLDGIDHVMTNPEPCFVLCRPPGHHATPTTGMGFCLFSNAAIAANYALSQTGIDKVAILDWDVHHGNGTEAIVEHNPNIIYCSIHQSPCYPGTGSPEDTGLYNNVLNLPVSAGSTIKEYQQLFEDKIVPFIQQFAPDLLIISAGYDANQDDPLAGVSLQPEDYGVFTRYCLNLTPKIVFGLEGGYDLDALAKSVEQTIVSCLQFGQI